jgi:hypothetical protein
VPLLHGFEEGGLRFWRGAVDLVSEDNVGEEGAGLKIEHPLAIDLLEDRVARDVAGEKIRSELDALGIEDEGLGKPLDELGFAETRETLEENVTPGKNSGDDEFDQFLLAEENLVEGADKRPDMLAGIGDFGFRGVLHIQ